MLGGGGGLWTNVLGREGCWLIAHGWVHSSRFSASAVRNRVPIEERCCLGGANLSCWRGCGVRAACWATGSCVPGLT